MKLSIHTSFAVQIVAKHDEHLLDYGPDEQTGRVLEALHRISKVTTLAPLGGQVVVDLAGFAEAPVVYITEKDEYLLLSDIAEGLGWPLYKADAWARLQHGYAIRDQRDHDEERGDGRLGWECLLDYIDLRLSLVMDDPEAKPDAGGRRWSHAGDWLISKDRLPALLMSSPWGKEFMDNSMDAFRHAAREIFGDKLRQSSVYGPDGQLTGGSAFDLFEPKLSKNEALRRARRGPALDEDGDES